MQKNVTLTQEQIVEAVQNLFPNFDGPKDPKAKINEKTVKINMLNLSTEAILKIADFHRAHPGIEPWIKRSGTGIVITFEDRQAELNKPFESTSEFLPASEY